MFISSAKSNPITERTILARGKCVQNTAPTPDNPVDIVCNNGKIVFDSTSSEKWKIEPITNEILEDAYGNTFTVENLLSTGVYADTQDVLNGILTKRVGVKVLTGNEFGWSAPNISTSGCKLYRIDDLINPKIGADVLSTKSTHFKPSSLDADLMTLGEFKFSTVFTTVPLIDSAHLFFCSSAQTLAEWKAWLAQQYAYGTPVIVTYPLQTPITQNVTTPQNGLVGTVNVKQSSINDSPLISFPNTYIPLEYVEADSNFINTELYIGNWKFTSSNDQTIHYTIMPIRHGTNVGGDRYMGTRWTSTTGGDGISWIYRSSDGVNIIDYFTGNRYQTTKTLSLNNKYRLDIVDFVATVTNMNDNATVYWRKFGFPTKDLTFSSLPLLLNSFNGADNGLPTTPENKLRIYDFEVENLSHLIPVKRTSDNAVGLYDIIRNMFLLPNTGELIAGPAINTCENPLTIMGTEICAENTQPSGTYLVARQNGNKYYINLSEEENPNNPKPITNESNNVLRIKIGNTIYNAHDGSVE